MNRCREMHMTARWYWLRFIPACVLGAAVFYGAVVALGGLS